MKITNSHIAALAIFLLFTSSVASSATMTFSDSLTQSPVGDPDLFTTQTFKLTFTNVPTNAISDATIDIAALGDFSMTNNIEYLAWSVEGLPYTESFDVGGNDFQSVLYDSGIIPLADLLPVISDGSIEMNFFVPSDVEPYAADGTASYVTATISYMYTPIPPALYLFGSGLLGLVGISRHKKA
jgi:hypothetical protein